jgi:DTW domain-containing protein YfiP
MSDAKAARVAALHALPPHARRAAQVRGIISRGAARVGRLCAGCGAAAALGLCFCGELGALSAKMEKCPHALLTLLHARELVRSNSTHRLLAALWPRGDAAVVVHGDAAGGGAAAAAWARVLRESAVDGRAPLVLFPASGALGVAAVRARFPAARGARLVLCEGTWCEARTLAKDLAALGATLCKLQPLPHPALFQACRRQPAPGKVSTAEAVALFCEEWLRAGQAPGAAAPFPLPPPPLPPPLGPPAAPFSQALHLHAARLPTVRSSHAQVTLLAVATLVDRAAAQTGLLGGPHSRGAGYRTWVLGPSCGPFLGAVPAWIVERVCEYAYGPGAAMPSGYLERARPRKGGGGGEGGEEEEEEEKGEEEEEEEATEEGRGVGGTNYYEGPGTVQIHPPLNRKSSKGGYPVASQFSRAPLSQCNKALRFFFAGYWLRGR